nr:VWA domain-containing protein [Pseudomonas massiliensis]
MLEFAWPLIFLLLPLPWVLRRALPPAETGEQVLQVGFLDELAALSQGRVSRGLPGWRQQLPYALVWFCLVFACARPQWLGPPLPMPATGRDLMVAVDVSGSMDYPDMQWHGESVSRLSLVKHLLGDFLEARQGDRVGLILFGTQAYLQAPLTFDRRTVRTWLDEAQVGIAGQTTAVGDAIGLAIKRLRARPADSRVLVLVTDGANNGGHILPPTPAPPAAAAQGRIPALGLGAGPTAAAGGPPPGGHPPGELSRGGPGRAAGRGGGGPPGGEKTGGHFPPRPPARLAAAEQVRIHAIGIGADPTAAAAGPPLGVSPRNDLDEAALQAIASATGGEYFRARDGRELDAIGQALDRLEPVNQQPTRVRPIQELYHWPLAAAVLATAALMIQRLLPLARRLPWVAPLLPALAALRARLDRLRRRP